MPLYINKQPITIIGLGTPFLIPNLYAHRIIDDDTSRIMLLSTIGGELNTLQHFGHNSRKISIRGRINLATSALLKGIATVDTILTGLRLLKETKSAILVIMNHGLCYGVIDKLTISDDRDYPTSFDYELSIIEKDFFGMRFSAISQRILSGLIGATTRNIVRANLVKPGEAIPDFSDLR